ncbi:MAG TPA: NrfD/PsrC family molybdoenzyme membrane anchor subunit, partial [Dehalococcoidia bacterium]|nr:NrfD/PsrC family molybdoenzyme membrane anchor subunit [Dehalococcoidia bacterium]
GFPIVVFVWWIGIGHAGTLISAILLLFNQSWRTSINRFAEAMTLFAVANAGLMPIIHLGRPWYFYWLFPYPNTMGIWPQFRSPLLWDVFAISTYASVSLVFWYLGLVPDFATMRDRAKPRLARIFYGILSLGWRNSVRHWVRFDRIYLILAAFATPLVVSVHSVISFDFAYGNVPGWHSTVFPPYFVAGALLSGFAMVLTLAIPLRAFYRLHDMVTITHLENCAKVMLASGMVVGYGYVTEAFTAWYSGNQYELTVFASRLWGGTAFPQAAAVYWIMIICNVLLPQLVWIKRFRTNVLALFIMSFIVNVGMWAERYNIVVTSLNRNYLVSSWQSYAPTGWDWAMYAGTLGFFFALLFLFVRLVPMIPAFEMRHYIHALHSKDEAKHDHH